MGEARWLTVRAAADRDIEVLVDGPDEGAVLLFHDGSPTAAVRFSPLTNPAAKRHLRTVT